MMWKIMSQEIPLWNMKALSLTVRKLTKVKVFEKNVKLQSQGQ